VGRLWRVIKRLLLVVLVLVLVLVVALGGLFTWLVVRGFPQREGSVQVPGLKASVRVVRDQFGIANIYASSTEDLFAAQGYVHASERMWQMEVWRRISSGRLSELFGDDSLENDRYIRTLGWRHAAEQDWTVMSPEGRLALESYATGVNAWINQHGDLPLPFVIAGLQGAGGGISGFRPEPWSPIDTLAWQKVQAWSLGDNYGTELLRQILRNRGLTPDQIAELAPPYSPDRPIVVPDSAATAVWPVAAATPTGATSHLASRDALALAGSADRLRATIATAGAGAALAGSNGFVVAPARSDSGGALLANDPHLDISMPSLWFLVGLHCEPVGPACPYETAGAGFPGVPGIVLGHNARIAWGLTNVGPDTQDVFEETLDPNDVSHYMYKGESRAFDVHTETIKVSGDEDVQQVVRSTVHGPVMSDVEADFDQVAPDGSGGAGVGREGYVYSLAWAATAQPDRTLDSVLAVNRAQDFAQFREALRNFGAPSQTFLYADVDGHIGIQIPGWFPIRNSGDGSYIANGASGENDWLGFVPFDQLPYSYDPADGLIVASNNQPNDPAAGPYIGKDFDPGYRAARIRELLESGDAGGKITPDLLRTIQGDVKLTRAAPVVAALSAVTASTDDGETLRQKIVEWGPTAGCGTDSVGCAAYETFEYWLMRRALDDELGAGLTPDNAAWRYVGSEAAHDFIGRLIALPNSAWWDDTTTADKQETMGEALAAALDAGAADLRASRGDPSRWTWGSLHTVTFQEQTLGTAGIGPLEWIFNKGPYPAPGSCTTVNKVCGWTADEWPAEAGSSDLQHRFAAGSSPSYRLVIDMSHLDQATILNTTGQSGLPFDGHYGDFIERWLSNQPLPLPWSTDAVNASQKQVLTLNP
jgi:penicillin amidase